MKKVFTLFAAALLSIGAFAQDEPCPSKLAFVPVADEQPANRVELELTLMYNNSQNLNGFNIETTKTGGQWVNFGNVILPSYFTADGYGHNILGNLAGQVSDADLDAALSSLCDVKSNVKESGNLVIIELLSTLNCRFFPAVEEGTPLPVGKCALDLSAEEDGDYTIQVEAVPAHYSFSYTGGPEGTRAWTGDEDIVLTLTKTGDIVKVKGEEPQPVEYNAFYLTGTFNEWNEDVANMVELTANEEGTQFTGVIELEQDAEFKVVTPLEDGLKWFGGVDENQVGYFLINDGVLNNPIDLIDGANFRVDAKAKYTITVMQPADGLKGVQEPLVMTVTRETTGISTIASDNAGDNRIFDLQGRQLQSVPEHGVYIQNGKKYVK